MGTIYLKEATQMQLWERYGQVAEQVSAPGCFTLQRSLHINVGEK